MVGDRDSEIGISFNDAQLADNLRKKLWREHLGLPDDYPLTTVINDFDLWHNTARKNTKFYCKLFGDSIPENNPQKISTHVKARESMKSLADVELSKLLEEHLKGHVVKFPHNFLQRDLESNIKIFDVLFR